MNKSSVFQYLTLYICHNLIILYVCVLLWTSSFFRLNRMSLYLRLKTILFFRLFSIWSCIQKVHDLLIWPPTFYNRWQNLFFSYGIPLYPFWHAAAWQGVNALHGLTPISTKSLESQWWKAGSVSMPSTGLLPFLR